ncbi:hypothetical protein QCA50_008169 [Cerrena zonata]|uniref:Uncharacterized protein n=1 Tax=Cerrena zonata TaxID=2478898 RepID=A0AAW0G797_9APHY
MPLRASIELSQQRALDTTGAGEITSSTLLLFFQTFSLVRHPRQPPNLREHTSYFSVPTHQRYGVRASHT